MTHATLSAQIESLAIDIRYAVRRLRRRPTLALLVVLLFGLGIGLNVGLFSVADAVLLGPLPFHESEDLYALWPARTFNKEMVDRADVELDAWSGVAAYTEWAFPVATDGGHAEQVASTLVSTNFFEVLGIAPRRGQFLRSLNARPGNDDVVIVSYEYWLRRLGGDEAAVGRTLRIDGRERTVIGVLPRGSRLLGRPNDLWMPYPLDRAATDYTSSFYLRAVGRLKGGSNPAAAVAELEAFSARLEAENPNYMPHDVVWPPTVEPLRSALFGSSTGLLRVLGLATLAVLLLVCANVSHLLLVHGEARKGELALLVALGAGRFRLGRALVIETMLLALAGGGVGWMVVAWSRGLLLRWLPEDLPRRADLTMDGRAMAVCLGVALLVTFLAVVLPARHALTRRGLGEGLRRSRGGAVAMGSTQRWLITLEVAAVLTLVMTAVLLGRSLQALTVVDPGVEARSALTFRIHPPSEGSAEADDGVLWSSVLERIRELPGVHSAGGIQLLPLAGDGNWSFPYLGEGQQVSDGPLPVANFRVATPGYATAAGLQVLSGRDFDRRDRSDSAPVGWVNQTLAEQLWPGETAVGKVIQLFGNQPFTVVGVVGDVHQLGLRRTPSPAMYLPISQYPVSSLHLVVRTRDDPLDSMPAIRALVAGLAPEVAISEVRTFDEVLRRSVGEPRLVARLTGAFAFLAFFLGWCGILAVLAQLVEARTPEIGVRLALGAGTERIERDVLRSSLRPAILGIVLGSALALASGWWLRTQLFEVRAWDPAALGMAIGCALSAVLLGAWWPARRASRIDPARALHTD